MAANAPFVGCDGEGAGVDDLGRQNYMLLRIGDQELYTGKPLSTVECLGAICDAPHWANLVGFAFGYDTTMILRDLNPERRARVLTPKERGEGKSPYTYYETFGIDYLPRNYLAICRLQRVPDGSLRPVPDSRRTIWETFGFFQTSFAKTLKNFNVGMNDLAMIEIMKAAREDFETMTDAVREYNRLECHYLAELMERLREYCIEAGIMPRTWSGAGKLATTLHANHKTVRRQDVELVTPAEVMQLAKAAYYGGRFEVSRVGHVKGPIHEYDIGSAYPDAMRNLPCLIHGKWKPLDAKSYSRLSDTDCFVASVRFSHERGSGVQSFNGLPIRTKKGHIVWPGQGNGVYWSDEIHAARLLGCRDFFRSGWVYERTCACAAFEWIEALYEYRKKIGSKTVGYPIKLGMNSLYGKLAQRIGNPVYGNFIWAGMITARTRAKLMRAIVQKPDDIIMVATDAVYSLSELDLPVSERLGEWEHQIHDRMFIVQPGLYWGPPKPKTRGVPVKFFETRTDDFERKWNEFRELDTAAFNGRQFIFPHASVEMQSFTGLKLAQARGKPETAGRWVTAERQISFDWTRKRAFEHEWVDGHIVTFPLPGSRDLVSVHHGSLDPDMLGIWEGAREEVMDQPDYVDLSIPWKD